MPLTPAPRTITASAGWDDSSRCPARMTQISTADNPKTSAASPIWAIRSKIFQPRWRRLNRLRPSSTRQTSASPQLSFRKSPPPADAAIPAPAGRTPAPAPPSVFRSVSTQKTYAHSYRIFSDPVSPAVSRRGASLRYGLCQAAVVTITVGPSAPPMMPRPAASAPADMLGLWLSSTAGAFSVSVAAHRSLSRTTPPGTRCTVHSIPRGSYGTAHRTGHIDPSRPRRTATGIVPGW